MSANRPQAQRVAPSDTAWLASLEARRGREAVVARRIPESEIQALMEAPPGEEPEESTEERHRAPDGSDAMTALASLPELHQRAFCLTRMSGLSYADAAKALGVSKAQCWRLAKAAHEQLIEALGGKE